MSDVDDSESFPCSPTEQPKASDSSSSKSSSVDVSKVAELTRKFPDEEKNQLLQQRKLSEHVDLPIKYYTNRRRASGFSVRHCKGTWFDQFCFLNYSEKKDGIFCLLSVLFPVAAEILAQDVQRF